MDRVRVGSVVSRGAMALLVGACVMMGCGKSDEPRSRRGKGLGGGGDAVAREVTVEGRVVGGAMTRVVAMDAATNGRSLGTIEGGGRFSLRVAAMRSWIVTFEGADGALWRWSSDGMDTVVPGRDARRVVLGDLAAGGSGVLSGGVDAGATMGVSADAARLIGTMDDGAIRHAVRDIDGNGVADVDERLAVALGYEHVITGSAASGGARYTMESMRNAYLPDDVVWMRVETAVRASMDAAGTRVVPRSYRWSFSADTELAERCSNGGRRGDILIADSWCERPLNAAGGDEKLLRMSLRAKELKGGACALRVGGREFRWPDMVMTELPRGGWVVLFVKFTVGEGGRVNGLEWKWKRPGGRGGYVMASAEELLLTIQQPGARVRVGTRGDELVVPLEPEGTLRIPGGGREGTTWSAVSEGSGWTYEDKFGVAYRYLF